MNTLKTKVALKAVRLDHVLFANAIAKKELTCLPGTARGSAREFNLNALVPLWIFARLTEPRGDHAPERLTTREAGKIADRIGRAVAEHPKANNIVVLTHMDDLIRVYPLEQIDNLSACMTQDFSNGMKLRDARIWDVQNIREHVQCEIDHCAP